jgi:hypothetical protein
MRGNELALRHIKVHGTNLKRTRERNFCSYCEYFISNTMHELDDFPSNAEPTCTLHSSRPTSHRTTASQTCTVTPCDGSMLSEASHYTFYENCNIQEHNQPRFGRMHRPRR